MNSEFPKFINGTNIEIEKLKKILENTKNLGKRKALIDIIREVGLQDQINILKKELGEACENIKILYEENRQLKDQLNYLESKVYNIEDEIR